MRNLFKISVIVGLLWPSMTLYAQIQQTVLPPKDAIKFIAVIGDSLTDIGNYASENPNTSPCLDYNAPVVNKKQGTHANKLWLHHLAEYYGIELTTPYGANYAVASYVGAHVTNTPRLCGLLPEGRSKQWCIEASKHALQVQYDTIINSELWRRHDFDPSKTLAVILGGANDIKVLLESGRADSSAGLVLMQAGQAKLAIMRQLYAEGVRHFLVIGLPDLAQTPLLSRQREDTRAQIRRLIEAWNTRLISNVPKDRSVVFNFKEVYDHPDANVYTWTPFESLDAIVANPDAPEYGFKRCITNTQASGHLKAIKCLRNSENNKKFWCIHERAEPTDKTPDDYIFFDFIHPTAKTHHLFFKDMLATARLYT